MIPPSKRLLFIQHSIHTLICAVGADLTIYNVSCNQSITGLFWWTFDMLRGISFIYLNQKCQYTCMANYT